LERTIQATKDYPGEIEWILIENGECQENYEFFRDLPLERKVVLQQRNYGINQALNQGWALSRGEFCLIHENDWVCNNIQPEFLSRVKGIFRKREDVGVVQLRAVYDPNQNWGLGKPLYSPWSCSAEKLNEADVYVESDQLEDGHTFFVSNHPNGFNNNPVCIRKSLYECCGPYPEAMMGCDPRHGETEYQGRVAETGMTTAHIGLELYYHKGLTTTRLT
jgi:glycosyltransferase involved in cell wall biosynthesis